MKRLVVVAALGLATTASVKADGLFMGVNWGGSSQRLAIRADLDPRSRSEDTVGVAAGKTMRFSKQVYAAPYQGFQTFDGICDAQQSRSYQTEGEAAYWNQQPTHVLYKSGQGSCAYVEYPGFTFFGGLPNMALAPRWNGAPDFIPMNFNYMDYFDPRYNPALRNGG
jgi:hypothetical protein